MLTAQPCPRQIHPKSSLPYENTRLNHREGMKLHVFVRRDFWVSGLPPVPQLAASQLAATTSLSAL